MRKLSGQRPRAAALRRRWLVHARQRKADPRKRSRRREQVAASCRSPAQRGVPPCPCPPSHAERVLRPLLRLHIGLTGLAHNSSLPNVAIHSDRARPRGSGPFTGESRYPSGTSSAIWKMPRPRTFRIASRSARDLIRLDIHLDQLSSTSTCRPQAFSTLSSQIEGERRVTKGNVLAVLATGRALGCVDLQQSRLMSPRSQLGPHAQPRQRPAAGQCYPSLRRFRLARPANGTRISACIISCGISLSSANFSSPIATFCVPRVG